MSPGRFTHRHVGMSGGCRGGRKNVLAVGKCCYVAVCSTAQSALAPTGEERGGAYRVGRPPTIPVIACYTRDAALHRHVTVTCQYCVEMDKDIITVLIGLVAQPLWFSNASVRITCKPDYAGPPHFSRGPPYLVKFSGCRGGWLRPHT